MIKIFVYLLIAYKKRLIQRQGCQQLGQLLNKMGESEKAQEQACQIEILEIRRFLSKKTGVYQENFFYNPGEKSGGFLFEVKGTLGGFLDYIHLVS
jgi:hypothetical protein